MRAVRRHQRDLFDEVTLPPELPPALQGRLGLLLQALLMEAACAPHRIESKCQGSEEGGDDQGHA